eukprot:1254150-Pyramimonas_sp.AAC.1
MSGTVWVARRRLRGASAGALRTAWGTQTSSRAPFCARAGDSAERGGAAQISHRHIHRCTQICRHAYE